MSRVPAIAVVLAVLTAGVTASFAFGAGQTTTESGGTVTQTQTADDGTVVSQVVPPGGISQQSSGGRHSVSIQAVGRPQAGQVFSVDVKGSDFTCSADLSDGAVVVSLPSHKAKTSRKARKHARKHRRSARKKGRKHAHKRTVLPSAGGCSWAIPGDAAGKSLTVTVDSGSSHSQMGFVVR